MLHRNEHCSNAMHDFLALIETHMLVPSPGKRYAMSEVRDTLRQIAIKCQRDDDYCYKGSPERSLGEQIRELCSLARYYRTSVIQAKQLGDSLTQSCASRSYLCGV